MKLLALCIDCHKLPAFFSPTLDGEDAYCIRCCLLQVELLIARTSPAPSVLPSPAPAPAGQW